MEHGKNIANFLFEAGILSKTPRSGFFFLGSGDQSVAEHLFRAAIIGYTLAKLDGTLDSGKVATMCLFHDFAEGRVSDLNYVHQKYTERFEEKAFSDLAATLPFGEDMAKILHEYEERQSREAILTKEADNLEFILSLKEQIDIGNARAKDWFTIAVARLKTDLGRELANEIMNTDSSEWWFGNKNDEWWVSRNKPQEPSQS